MLKRNISTIGIQSSLNIASKPASDLDFVEIDAIPEKRLAIGSRKRMGNKLSTKNCNTRNLNFVLFLRASSANHFAAKSPHFFRFLVTIPGVFRVKMN